MKNEKILRCFAVGNNNIYQAFCIDLGLAVQGESFDEVKDKLDAQIHDYVYDAIEGEDKEYRDQLLSRKSPISIRVKYYWYRCLSKIHLAKLFIKNIKFFNERSGFTDNHQHA